MKSQGCLSEVLYYARHTVLIDVALFAAVGLICLLTGRQTWHQYGESLTIAGALAISLGA